MDHGAMTFNNGNVNIRWTRSSCTLAQQDFLPLPLFMKTDQIRFSPSPTSSTPFWPLHFIWSFGHRTLIDLRFNHNQPFRSSNHKMVAYGHSQPLLIKLRFEAYNLNLTSSKAARLLFSFVAVPQLLYHRSLLYVYVCMCRFVYACRYVRNVCMCFCARALLIHVSLGSYQWYEVLYISILRI